MEFENLHDDVADLRSRVEKLEARLETADQVAHAALAEIKEHEAETVQPQETGDGKTDNEVPEQVTGESVRGAEPVLPNS